MVQQDMFGGGQPHARLYRRSSVPSWSTNYFFALYPPAGQSEYIRSVAVQLASEQGFADQGIEKQVHHLSLFGIGHDLSERIISFACQSAAQIRRPPFDVRLTMAMKFNGSGAVVLLAERAEIGTLHSDLYRVYSGKMPMKSDRINPHVTLCYDHSNCLMTSMKIAPICFPVREFALVKSIRGETKHEIIGAWPLRG